VKTYTITISRRGMPAHRYSGLFASDWDAIQSAIDIAAQTGPVDQPVGISAKAVMP